MVVVGGKHLKVDDNNRYKGSKHDTKGEKEEKSRREISYDI